ncbi:hypothetical protein QMT40_002040 [Parvibaculaceae bacterium PLY_AMNH_Bact1]|nr:hypothetical protein QMT40_002040 [Parvibaculaceae bacterium PLY_AMNH_Bact1]
MGADFRLTDQFLVDFLDVAKSWTSCHAGPDETNIDLLDAVRFLPLVFWYNLQADKSWVCRFFGSDIVGVRGEDPTQKPLERSDDNLVDQYVGAFFDLVVEAGEPVSSDSHSIIKGKEYLRTQSVGLPVFADDGTISGVIGAQVFYRPDEK